MVKKISFYLLTLFLIMQIVGSTSAFDTLITVKYAPDYKIRLGVLNPYSIDYSEYESFDGVFNEYGEATFTYSSSNPSFGLNVYISQDGQKVFKQRYPENYAAGEKYNSGESVILELEPEWYKKMKDITSKSNSNENISELNETIFITEEANVTALFNDSEDDSATITQFAIFGEDGSSILKIIVYIIGVLILIAIIVVIVLRVMKSMNKKGHNDYNDYRGDDHPREEIKVRKLSEMQNEKKDSGENYNETVDDAERKIKEALESIASLRKNDKIAEVKKRIVESEKELIRLRRGE